MKKFILVSSLFYLFFTPESSGSEIIANPSLENYGISKNYPFGRANPNAPKELIQFHFMIGNFDRKERLRNKDGSWKPWVKGEWNARYFMNGYGIIDESLNYYTNITTTNLRFFDPKEQLWKISWFKAPGYSTTYAEGTWQGDKMVIINPSTGDRYVMYNITTNSYDWELQKSIDGKWISVWQISLVRKKR